MKSNIPKGQEMGEENAAQEETSTIYYLENDIEEQKRLGEGLIHLAEETDLPEKLESWEVFEDYQTLFTQEKYTYVSRKSKEGRRFREFAEEFADYIKVRQQIEELVEDLFKENPSYITYRKSKWRGIYPEMSEEELTKKGIRYALELVLLTAATDCYKYKRDKNEGIIGNRIGIIVSQDTRYKRRIAHHENPEKHEKPSTKSWSVPYKYSKKVLDLLA